LRTKLADSQTSGLASFVDFNIASSPEGQGHQLSPMGAVIPYLQPL
jgi:hypothetical protein